MNLCGAAGAGTPFIGVAGGGRPQIPIGTVATGAAYVVVDGHKRACSAAPWPR